MTFDEMVALMREWEALCNQCQTNEVRAHKGLILDQIEAIKADVPFVEKWLYSERTTTIDMIIAATDRTTLEEIKYDMEHLDV